MNQSNVRLLVEAIVLYVIGEDNTRPMDHLTIDIPSDRQWEFVCSMFDMADEIKVDAGQGSVYQTEKVLAQREGRPCRYPSVFETDRLKRMEIERSLAAEFEKRKIKLQLPDYLNTH